MISLLREPQGMNYASQAEICPWVGMDMHMGQVYRQNADCQSRAGVWKPDLPTAQRSQWASTGQKGRRIEEQGPASVAPTFKV